MLFESNAILKFYNIYSQYLLFSLQFTVYINHELGNSQILKLTWRREFLSFKENTAIKNYSMRCLKTLKELKQLCEDEYKFVKKTTYVKYYK